jgi:alpha-N-arabinofuranosidase
MNAETSPIQGVGHGDLVQTQDSSWFIVAHAFRQFNGHQILGRETFLAPVRWEKNAWPVVNGDGTVSFNIQAASLPGTVMQKTYVQKDDFNEEKPGFEWNYLNNPIEANYSFSQRKGYLRLIGNDSALSQLPNVTFIGRRQQHLDFSAATSIDFTPKRANEEAGITLFKDAANHYDLAIKNLGNKRMLVLTYNIGLIHHVGKEIPIQDGPVQLSVSGTQEYYQFAFSQHGKPFTNIGKADTRYLSSVTVGGFTGVYIGLYATGNGQKSLSGADFDWFAYEPK